MKTEHEGICRLCGEYKKLSFEHIPPKKAFNDQQVVFQTIDDFVRGHSRISSPRRLGLYSLCEKCNSTTGSWYGGAFVNWTKQGFEYLSRLREAKISGNTSLSLPYYIKPLNLIKQVIVMALAMSPESAVYHDDDLNRFVLNKHQKYLPPKEKVYVYFTTDGQPRFTAGSAIVNIETQLGAFVRAEVSLPPFGYCISSPIKNKKSMADAQGLCNITWFSEFDYNIWTTIYLRIPVLETHGPFPLDYRSKIEIEEQMKKARQ